MGGMRLKLSNVCVSALRASVFLAAEHIHGARPHAAAHANLQSFSNHAALQQASRSA